MNEENPLYASARIGLDAEAFLASPLGQAIQQRANSEMDSNTLALIEADPSDVEENIRIRQRIRQARDAMQWLLDAIEEGRAAATELHQQQYTD